jgi:drug/metabolite transporter (DMT)-like permease
LSVGRAKQADLALAANTLIWAFSFVAVKQALSHASPLFFLVLRFTAAALVLGLLFRGRIHLRKVLSTGRGALVAGVCLFAGYVLQTTGLQTTTASKSAFLTGLSVPLVPLLSCVVYRKRPRLLDLGGALSATVGMGLMTLEGLVVRLSRGDLLTLAGAVAFAAHIVAVGHYSTHMNLESLSFVQIGAVAALAATTFWWAETPVLQPVASLWFAVLFTGLMATALTFTVQVWAQRHTTAARTALMYSLEPVAAALASYMLLGERLSLRAGLGAALIFSGILVVELKRANSAGHLSNWVAIREV